MLSVSKPASSLVEQKKQQWAREREEMSHLYLPWGSGERYTNRPQIRNQFTSSLELHKQSLHEYEEPIQRQRSPSLPPIHNIDPDRLFVREEKKHQEILNRNIPSAKRFSFYDEDAEGDTSGYGSETINQNRRQNVMLQDEKNNITPITAWQQDAKQSSYNTNNTRSPLVETSWSSHSPRSANVEEGRPKWGDRGVATGRLWEPTAPNARLPQMQNEKKGTPSWVERGLNMIENTSDVLVIDQRSSTNSGLDCDRWSCNGSDEARTYLRGQNVPLEPDIKAQREIKRTKALELQSVILSQLEDRERRRQEERDQKLMEERLEELRIQKQQEEDRIKLEEERKRNEEKQFQEQRKLETLKKALDEAERMAKQEKERKFNYLKTPVKTDDYDSLPSKLFERVSAPESTSPTKTNRTYDLHSAKSQQKEAESQHVTEFNSPRSMSTGNLNLFIHNMPPLAVKDSQFNVVPLGINGNGEIVNGQTAGIQLAVLVPQNLSNSLYSVSLNSVNTMNEFTESDKILTPRQYRKQKTKHVATQTDVQLYNGKQFRNEEVIRNFDKDYLSIDENAPQDSHHNTMKKDRRLRSEDRYKQELENRPKWGVNRPAAQYKKQSEKDPFYSQKRKVRQKYRPPARQYLSQSSDDSRSPSPSRKGISLEYNSNHRNSLTQSYWKNKRSSHLSRHNSVSESLGNTLSDINSLAPNTGSELSENKISPKLSPNKRMTLSQKFINDKYGNRKLWLDDTCDIIPRCQINHADSKKKTLDQINISKRELMIGNEKE